MSVHDLHERPRTRGQVPYILFAKDAKIARNTVMCALQTNLNNL